MEHSLLPDKNFTQLATVPATAGKIVYSYRDSGLGYGETYYYRVKAKSGSGDSPYSTTVSATTFAQSKVFNIMPLGDSNTHGTKSGDTRPDAQRIAYRKQLYDLLTGAKAKFLYVGSERAGSAFLSNDQNAGFPAARTMDILSLLKTSSYRNQANELVSRGSGTYLDKFNPDVVLLHLGTNGGIYGVTDDEQAIAEMAGILDEVDAYEARSKKEVTVILGLIINRVPQSGTDEAPGYTSRFNDRVKAMAENRIKAKSDRIVVVDMEKSAGIVYQLSSKGGDMDDYLHPAPSGYQKMANKWFEALKPLLEPNAADTKAPETTIVSKPAAISNSNSATFEFASNEAKVYYEMSLNGAAFATTTNPLTLSNLADGTYNISVRAVDAAGNKDSSPATYTWTIITAPPTPPVFSAVSEDRGPKNDDQITSDNSIRLIGKAQPGMDVTVSESTKGTLGTIKASSTGDWVYNYEGTTLAAGTYRFTATAKDIAGNVSEVSKVFTITIDLTKPEIEITTQAKSPTKEAFQVQLMFSEEVYGLTAADLTVANAALSNFTAKDKSTYTATLTPPAKAQGIASIMLAAGKVTDLAGNGNTASSKLEVAYDLKRPKVALSSEAPQLIKTPFTVRFTFDEEVTGFSAADISVFNGTISNFNAVSGSVYTAQVNPDSDGEVSVSLSANKATDAAGNGNEASAVLKRVYDVEPPKVTLSTASGNLGNTAFTVNIEFSEPITGLVLQSFNITNGRVSDLKKTGNTTYTVQVTPEKDGEITLSIGADQVKDQAENGNLASNLLKREFDATPPNVVLSTKAPELTNAPFTVNILFSEEVVEFEMGDISLTNATAGNFRQVSNAEYTVEITPVKDGEVTVKVAAGKAKDAATNANTASNIVKLAYDATAPAGYTVRFDVDKVDFSNQKNIGLSVTGAEAGATYFFTISSSRGGKDVTGTATATAASFSRSGIDVSGLNDGQLTVTFYQVDAAGNQGEEVKAEVVKLTKNIVAVSSAEQIRVPFKTTYKDLPLPKQLEVTYSNGEKEQVEVDWQEGNYNGLKAGSYTLSGILELKPNTTNQDNRKASITVVVEPNRAPIALQLSASSFKPDSKPEETIGTFSTNDPDDDTHTYTLVSGLSDQHNNLFMIEGDRLYLKSNNGLSGIRVFNIRVRSTDPYQNSLEQTFVLSKSTYQPETKIKLVNAFSPDNDGINDTWTVPELKFYDEISIQVFDRAGVRLFHTTNPEEGWDGRSQNGEVKQGNYFYIIEVKDINLVQKGVLTVLK
ncbi:MAG: Ig-like domain-containing protein [Hymenobacteraceae bacterium]|nr:Ig-like domain-containing protein [Hymenobacteraceae bacterium]